jgi:hypothetical protein
MSRKPKIREPHMSTNKPVLRAKSREKEWEMGATRGQVRNCTMEVMEKMKEIRRGVEWNLFFVNVCVYVCVCMCEFMK